MFYKMPLICLQLKKYVTLQVLCFMSVSLLIVTYNTCIWKNKINLYVYHNHPKPICSPLYEIVFILYTWITLL